jgi:UDP-2,3-diacylglucosamine pyrophosphatase LpxH
MKINPGKSKAVSFTKARVKESKRYYFGDQLIPEASNFKYVNYTLRKTWKALYFIMRTLKKGKIIRNV